MYVPVATTASVRLTVRSAAVPSKADEETSIMPEIRRPKVHRVGHEGCQVGLDRGVTALRDTTVAHEIFQSTASMLLRVTEAAEDNSFLVLIEERARLAVVVSAGVGETRHGKAGKDPVEHKVRG